MENQKTPSVEQILQMMEQNLGEKPVPMIMMSKLVPEWVPKQAQEGKFVFDLPNISEKYKHLIIIAAALAAGSKMCTEMYMKKAKKAGITNEEIGEAILTAPFRTSFNRVCHCLDGIQKITE
ncbi:carboxymuconolactone decarboxylase family protein [Desulfoscipio geothermicus]|uniref:Alkylhydroperoxidase AhpD family core domain-containing protein n=1 Tax=Desulfoscipio geothermicus DSM 3669 TaxID=1121426 RepID=A0A1I6E0D7_9FIRM|nr:carboxymuconolactone decarboxylase family protein [Desulfoscipio geothermicus]SFR11219.1 alkylhydroperoxidase AhpD family core domain-containing protein [Desulfoscipio geothermicus DSM 3669]